jgi:hypothetical protein
MCGATRPKTAGWYRTFVTGGYRGTVRVQV